MRVEGIEEEGWRRDLARQNQCEAGCVGLCASGGGRKQKYTRLKIPCDSNRQRGRGEQSGGGGGGEKKKKSIIHDGDDIV